MSRHPFGGERLLTLLRAPAPNRLWVLIYHEGPWKSVDDEWSTLAYVHWFNYPSIEATLLIAARSDE